MEVPRYSASVMGRILNLGHKPSLPGVAARMDKYDWESVMQFGDVEYADYDHLPTPPPSHEGTPVDDTPEDEKTLVSISTTFFPSAPHRPQHPDVALLSKDSVYFYVHSDVLLEVSENRFRAMLPISPSDGADPPVLHVPEPAPVLNIVLHAIYDMTCAHYSPPFDTLVRAVDSMPIYGITPKLNILPSTPLFTHLLSQAPLFPLELYALAAHHDVIDLAVPASSHLLGFPLSRLTDQVVERMGPTYLKRLFFLHFGRAEALKRVLQSPPHPHPPTASCDFNSQKPLSRAWALASSYLSWDVRPDMSTNTLESALRPLAENLSCKLCKNALNDRVKELIVQWSIVKVGSVYAIVANTVDVLHSERYDI